jgi:hypothetical protein
MAHQFIGLNVNITLSDGVSVIGPVAELADDGSYITLRGAIQRNGKLLKVREIQLQASDIKSIQAIKPGIDAPLPPPALTPSHVPVPVMHYAPPPPPHYHAQLPPHAAPYPQYAMVCYPPDTL